MPQRIGRSLVNAYLRELEQEEKAMASTVLQDTTNEQPTPSPKKQSMPNQSEASLPVAPRPSRIPAYSALPRPIIKPVVPYIPLSLVDENPIQATVAHFHHFLDWFRETASNASWKGLNRMTQHNAPRDLYKHLGYSILVFQLKHTYPNLNPLIGATLYRKANWEGTKYCHLCDSLMEIDRTTSHIVRRETNWDNQEGLDGMFVYMFRHMMVGCESQIRVFRSPLDFEEAQSEGTVGNQLHYSLCLFQEELTWLV